MSEERDKIRELLAKYSTCDISDALLKLKKPRGGFLPGVTLWSPERQEGSTKLVGPVYTVRFVLNIQSDEHTLEKHYIDTIPPDSVIFISSPLGIPNAVYGGLMSHRAVQSGALGTVVDGNIRDLGEHRRLDFPVFARDVVTPAYYEVARASEVNIPVIFHHDGMDVIIKPGDWIVGDLNGVVCIPQSLLLEVAEILPLLAEADEKVQADIDRGITFADAVKKHRTK